MKHLLPGKNELLVFAVLAVVCGAIAYATRSHDLTLSALSVPLFITAAVMGLRRNWQMAEGRQTVAVKMEDEASA